MRAVIGKTGHIFIFLDEPVEKFVAAQLGIVKDGPQEGFTVSFYAGSADGHRDDFLVITKNSELDKMPAAQKEWPR